MHDQTPELMLPAIANTIEQRHGYVSYALFGEPAEGSRLTLQETNTFYPTSSQHALQGRERYPIKVHLAPLLGWSAMSMRLMMSVS